MLVVQTKNRFVVRRSWVGVVVLAAAAACQSGDAPGPSPTGDDPDAPIVEAPSGQLVAGPAQDVASSVPAAELAFRELPGAYAGGYRTHDVRIADGIIDVTPKHLDPITRETVTGGAIGLETTAIHAGAQVLDASNGTQQKRDSNVVEITRGEAVEIITNREDGIEQAWRFAQKPSAEGDLTVEVAVSSQQFVAETESGLHFKSAAGLGIRYSHAIWRDAAGAEFDVPAHFDDGRILITVPETVIASSTFPALLDPTITAELLTDVPTNGATGANSRNQDIATDGTGFFAVWQDTRDSRNDDIFGARIDAAGVVTSTTSIRINNAAGVQQNPTTAYVGTGYVVAWENVVAANNSDVVAAFVSAAGAVTQLGTLSNAVTNETGLTIAARGTTALLVWQDGTSVRGAIYDGATLGAPFNIAAGVNVEKEPTVSANPAGDYLVAYSETVATGNDDIRGVMVSSTGTVGTPFTIDAATSVQITPSAAFDGTNHVVVWNSRSDVVGARVSAAGALLDATPLVVTNNGFTQQVPEISCTTASCFVTWQDSRNAASVRDIYGALVTTGLVVTFNDIAVATQTRAQLSPASASAGSTHYVTWTDNRDLEYFYARGARITDAGAQLDVDGVVLALGTARLQTPVVAQTGTTTDIVFGETAGSDVNLANIRFSGVGTQLDNPGKTVSNAAGAQLNPAAATIGSNVFAVWQDTRGVDRDIYGARISMTTGLPLDAVGVVVSNATADQTAPAIATGGASALVVWQDRRNGATTGFDIYGAIVDANGAVTVNNIAICAGAGDQSSPEVAYDTVNQRYLVVWNEPSGATTDIRGVRVSAAGAVLDASCGTAISASAGSQFSPDVTYGAGRFFVVWEDRRNEANSGDIYGARVDGTSGINVLDPNGIAIARVAGSAQSQPTVAFGTGYSGAYVVAWADGRTTANLNDIYGAQVNISTGAVDVAFPIANTTQNETAPDMSAGADTTKPFNVAYSKTNTALSTTRIQYRRVAMSTSSGQPCSSNSNCATGFCSDGVCCDTACGGTTTADCQACSARRGASADGTCTVVSASLFLICRDYANRTDSPNCDVREYCDGINPLCPADVGANQGRVCTKFGGATGLCPSNTVAGAPHVCI